MADPFHALFHCRGEKARRRSAPAVFCAGGVLRQSHLSSSCCRRCPRATAPRRQSHHRSTQQTHLDLRPPHHSPSRRQAPNGNRGYEPTQPGDPQPLPQGLPQAIRPRPLPPPHRICDQQYLHRLRHWQGRGESSSIAAEAKRHHRYLEVQQDILETFVDHEELRQLTQPTLLPNGRRIPGLKLDQPRQLALMHSLVRFCYLAAEGTFTTRDLYPQTLQALRRTPEEYKLGSLRYDLWKLRAKGLVEKIPHSRRYRLLPHGYQICLVFLKLYEKIYAPLTAGILQPFVADESIPKEKITALDRRYTAVIQALDDLVEAVGLKAA